MSHPRRGKNKTKKDDGDLDMLPPDFEPSEWDVICQRGKECFEHVGNRRFRAAIDRNLDRYLQVHSRHEKSIIVSEIVGTIRAVANASMSFSGGGFVRKDLLTRQWYRVGDKIAREKAGQALRDAIKTKRATERKRVQNDAIDETCHYDPSCTVEHAQHTFQPPSNIENSRYSDHDDGGSSSMARGVKREHETFEIHELSQDSTVRPPSSVHSNDLAVSSRISRIEGSILGSSKGHGLSQQCNARSDNGADFLSFNAARHQHQADSFLSFLPAIAAGSKQQFGFEFLSALEPRPISAVARPCHDDKKALPIGAGLSTNILEEAVRRDRIGSMEYHIMNRNDNSIMVGESVTLVDEQKRLRGLAQQAQARTSSEESSSSSSALQLLTHLLQPETGNEISPYYKHFFVSSTNYWHSSHLDEFGFCCDIVGTDRPSTQQLADLADLGDSSSMLDETWTLGMMDHGTTGPATSIFDKTMRSQDHSLMKSSCNQSPPQALLQQGPQEQLFLPSTFGSDQFLTIGQGGGLVRARRGDSRVCFPDSAKSNTNPLASTLPIETKDWKNNI